MRLTASRVSKNGKQSGGERKMPHGCETRYSIRTPRKGARLGDLTMVNGKPALRVKAGKTEDYILPEEFVEAICGVPVAAIVFQEQAQPRPISAQTPTKA